ncbi:MAG TPA: YihY family inner membrane protein [Acidiferrobacterales bacterium]|nr:YihY family inner membrane protein [Acidiferrobacterales bacterium]
MHNLLRSPVQAWRLGRLVLSRFKADRCNRVAQALSYTTLLAVVPLTTVTFAVLSVLPVFQTWMTMIQNFIYGHFVPASGQAVQKYMLQFASKTAQLTAVGLLVLFITAVMVMATIEQVFNEIWRAPQNRKLAYRFLIYWSILTLGPILFGLSLSITSYLVSLPLFAHPRWQAFSDFRHFFLGSLPFLFEVLAFMLLYMVIPNVRVKWQHALTGSVFAAILFEIAKHGFTGFVLHYSSYQLIYGAIAALPVFLIWIYLSWIVILLGAIFVAELPLWGTLDAKLNPRLKKK